MRQVSRVVAVAFLLAAGWSLRASAGPDEWLYDPDPGVEAIYRQVAATKAETARAERLTGLAGIPVEARRQQAQRELDDARELLTIAKTVLGRVQGGK